MRGPVVALAVTAVVALAAPASQAADECRGLMACISVPGPWVAIPAPARGRPSALARWQLRCPEGIVAGLDARVSDRAVDVGFVGLLGSPVNPGITTRDSVVFTGTYAGLRPIATSFRPFLGCIRGGGGGRTPTRAQAFRPGQPLSFRTRTLRLRGGSLTRGTHRCRPGERLLEASHAAGFFTPEPPPAAQLALVRVTRAVRRNTIFVAASRQGVRRGVTVVVQIQALCARSPG